MTEEMLKLAREFRQKLTKGDWASWLDEPLAALLTAEIRKARLEEAKLRPHQLACSKIRLHWNEDCDCETGKRISELEAERIRSLGGTTSSVSSQEAHKP